MKWIFSIFLTVLALKGMCQTSAEWRSDLTYLQEKVHHEYSNLFYSISPSEWDNLVANLHSQIPKLEKGQIIVGFMEIVASFHINHTRIAIEDYPSKSPELVATRLPIQLYEFSDGIYITAVKKEYKKVLGAKVIRIGDIAVEDALKAIRPLISFENEQGFKYASMRYYLPSTLLLYVLKIINNISEVPITYEKEGKIETIIIVPDNTFDVGGLTGLTIPKGWISGVNENHIPLWQKNPLSFRYMEYITESKTLYVRHSITYNETNENTVSKFFNEVGNYLNKNDVQKLILDVRTNEGGNSMLNPVIITNVIKATKVNQRGKLFCIIGRGTGSAAQLLINEWERYTPVIFVGEPTGENVSFFGDYRTVTLPKSGLPVRLSWVWWQHNPPTQENNIGTNPHLAAEMAFMDFQNGLDPAITAINNFQEQPRIEVQVKSLVEKNKIDEAIGTIDSFVNDPRNKYIKDELENILNSAGYEFVQKRKIEDANKLFGIIVKIFPESANAWDSYAESFALLGKIDEAIRCYEMAISKDKTGITAENSRKMIERIKNEN